MEQTNEYSEEFLTLLKVADRQLPLPTELPEYPPLEIPPELRKEWEAIP